MFGFGFNKEKSRANAERYLQQNKLQNAITEYEKILHVEPKDLAILNTVGDIYARLGQNEKAIERFRVVGEAYATDGFILKSIAMYRKITKLDPNGLAALEKLAELYRKQGLVSDARSTLLQAADAYTRKGLSKETLRLLKQLVLFDPENVQVITRTADLMTQSGQKNEAKEMLSQTASTLVERRALDPAQKILDRLISLDRSNLRAQEMRAQVILELGDAAKAAELFEAIPDLDSRADGLRNLLSAYLQMGKLDDAYLICRKLMSVHHDPEGVLKVAARLYKENDTVRALALYSDFSSELLAHDKEEVLSHLHGAASRVRNDTQALQTLYNLFQRAGETSMIPEVLELMAHAAVQSEQLERARDAYKELIELEPENASHVQGYRQVCARLNPVEAAPEPAPAPKTEREPATLEEFRTTTEPVLPKQNYLPHIDEEIANALTEADLCESFSSKTRGISFLESALQKAPDDLRLNRSLAMLYRQEGATAKAAVCYGNMQRVLEEMGEAEAASYYSNLAGSAQTTTWEAKGSEFAARDFDLGAEAHAAGSTEEIDLSSEWESAWQEPSSPATPASAPVQPVTTAAYPDSVSELLEEVRFCLAQQIWAEAEIALSRLASQCPTHPELPALRAELQRNSQSLDASSSDGFAPVEVIELGEDSSSALDHEPVPQTPAFTVTPYATPAAPPSLNALAAELDFELGDSFMPTQQPRREVASQPAPVAAMSAAAAMSSAPVPPAAHFAAPVPAAQAIPVAPVLPAPVVPAALVAPAPLAQPAPDFLAELTAESEIDSPMPEPSVFGDLLHDFEKDLDSPQDNDNDPETHFNLGIAFREMGLLDEAIGELQKVCRASEHLPPARIQQAYIWLATCFVEKGVPEASFKWFERALGVTADEESRTAVNYELASAYEAAGRRNEALSHFMEVYGSNIDYRDVAGRIRELRSAQ